MSKSLQNSIGTEYITNLRTINLKIKMLVHTFYIHPPAIQQQKPSSGAKKIYFTKYILYFTIEGLKNLEELSLCHIKKNKCAVFPMSKHQNLFLGCFLIPEQKYLGMQQHALFNAHFQVLCSICLIRCFSLAQFRFDQYLTFLSGFVPIVL